MPIWLAEDSVKIRQSAISADDGAASSDKEESIWRVTE
jgi:hypothetical protein